jgi:hypothetical protein
MEKSDTSLLPTKLRGVAALLRNGQSVAAPTLDQLLLEAAARLELPEDCLRAVGDASFNRLSVMLAEVGDKPRYPEGTPEYAAYKAALTDELDKWKRREAPYDWPNGLHLSECAISIGGLSRICTCKGSWPD